MYKIKIEKGKATKTSWDTDSRSYVTKEIESLVPYLDCPIEIVDTTFGQFFAFIEKDVDLYNTIYRSATYGFKINSFIDEIKKESKKPLDADFVEVGWGVDTEDGVISDYPTFHGWGTWDNPGAMPVPPEGVVKGGIAIEFTPLCDYKHLPLKLDNEYEIFSEELKPLYKTKKGFRIHDVLRAILYEITWAGDVSKGRSCPFDESNLSNSCSDR